MITYSEIQGAETPTQFAGYAHAYRSAAEVLCEKMLQEPARETWPNASVLLILSAKAVELFLKAAILARKTDANIGHHNIYELAAHYNQLFPEPELEWDVPFQLVRAGSSTEELLDVVRGNPVHSMLFRYPISKSGSEWKGAFGFEPRAALISLQGLLKEFERLERHFLPQGSV